MFSDLLALKEWKTENIADFYNRLSIFSNEIKCDYTVSVANELIKNAPIYNEVVDFAVSAGKISASLVQRKFRLGYNRAARIIDLLEERGIIGPQNGSKPREVLLGRDGGGEEE